VLVPSRTSYALTFNLTPAAGTSQQAITGFQMAAQRWSSLLSDNVTVNLNIGFQSLGAGILGQASSSNTTFAYTDTRNAPPIPSYERRRLQRLRQPPVRPPR